MVFVGYSTRDRMLTSYADRAVLDQRPAPAKIVWLVDEVVEPTVGYTTLMSEPAFNVREAGSAVLHPRRSVLVNRPCGGTGEALRGPLPSPAPL